MMIFMLDIYQSFEILTHLMMDIVFHYSALSDLLFAY